MMEAAADRPSYTILNEADIRQRQEDDLERVSTALSVPKATAIVLLRHFNWNVSRVFDRWLDDEDGVRNETGLLMLTTPVNAEHGWRVMRCGICLESFSNTIAIISCGHAYCRSCWSAYIGKSIHSEGSGCLLLRCPHPNCRAAVGEDMVSALVSDHGDKEKYWRYLLRSYVEDSYRKTKIKWCPAPGCDYAIDFAGNCASQTGGYDVYCRCSYSFCWKCDEEAHRPVDCDTVARWIAKNADESQNTDWVLANTKPCPECKRPIEKNSGCNHMTCSPPCKHEFCWTCLGKWSHKSTHICTALNTQSTESGEQEEKKREIVRAGLDRYSRFYERWATHQQLRRRGMRYLRGEAAEQLEKLSFNYAQPKPLLKPLQDAWRQVIECRRVLQWSYVYGYYLSPDQLPKTHFLDYLQTQAEHVLENFLQCTESEMERFLDGDASVADFVQYRCKLSKLTSVIGNYFNSLVRAMEDGLSEVCDWVCWNCEVCSFSNRPPATRCQMCFSYQGAVKFSF